MSGENLPPRQKMIGMMYLVLTALLALNISKDILDAFILVNNGLENTVVNYNEKNNLLYSDFDKAKALNPTKVTSFWERAQQARIFSRDLVAYIDKLKITLIKETDGVTQSEADTLLLKNVNNKDNFDIPTHILIGDKEDGSGGVARELRDKLIGYKESLVNLFSEMEQETLNLDLETADIQTTEGMENWEMGNFFHTPLAASVTLLSKIETDIKNAEFEVVNKLFQSVTKEDFKFDKIEAKIIPNANYVVMGEQYQANVFVAAYNTTQNPQILIGKYDTASNELSAVYDTVPVENGLGKYTVNTSKEGIFSYEGLINITSPSGEIKRYPFSSEYIVAKPSLVVSPDKMNVFYIGPPNPVSISVPGVASENIKATISGSGNRITKTANGKYDVKLVSNSPRDVNISVSATMPDGSSRSMGSMPFLAKKLPKPLASISRVSGEATINKNDFKGYKTVRANYGPEFIFNGLPLTLTNCKIEVFRGGQLIFEETKMKSQELTEETKKFFFDRLKKKDKVYFSKILARDVNGQTQTLSGIQLEVK